MKALIYLKSDAELVKACLGSNREAYKTLYDKYAALLFNVCMRYAKNREDAEDLLQESFVTAFSKLKQYKGIGSFEGWLKKITVNTALRAFERKRGIMSVFINDSETERRKATDVNIISEMEARDLITMIQNLPSGCRAVLNAYAIDGYSHKEISEMLGISVGTSKSQLHDARKLLQKMIENNAIVRKHKNEQ